MVSNLLLCKRKENVEIVPIFEGMTFENFGSCGLRSREKKSTILIKIGIESG